MGKRPFEQEAEQPRKRARIESSTTNFRGNSFADQNEIIATYEEKNDEESVGRMVLDVPPQTALLAKQKSVSEHIKKFESLIHSKRNLISTVGVSRS